MTTAAQVKKMVMPVLDRHPDLALVGRWLFLKPVHHFARAVLIDRTAYADEFEPRWLVRHIFDGIDWLPLTWGEFLANERSRQRGLWRMTDLDVELSLVEAIETQALPKLRAIQTLDDFLAYVASNTFGPHLYEWPTSRIILDVALGQLDHARAIAAAQVDGWSTDDPWYDADTRAENARLLDLCARLAADDRPGLISLLHEWEAATVRNLKIEHIWEPTPFPIELRS